MSVIRNSEIESRPGVAGGGPCVGHTRIPVWSPEQARRLGTSEAELLNAYTTLRAADLTNAWAYVRSHRVEIRAADRRKRERRALKQRLYADEDFPLPVVEKNELSLAS
jgi:uncharacterized protein (DUF433 family)